VLVELSGTINKGVCFVLMGLISLSFFLSFFFTGVFDFITDLVSSSSSSSSSSCKENKVVFPQRSYSRVCVTDEKHIVCTPLPPLFHGQRWLTWSSHEPVLLSRMETCHIHSAENQVLSWTIIITMMVRF
jgi:hypothetical protein